MHYQAFKKSTNRGIERARRAGTLVAGISAGVILGGSVLMTHAAGIDNKQTVIGLTPACATTSAVSGQTLSASARTESDGTVTAHVSTLSIRGTLNNCSSNLQAYNVTFEEVGYAGVPSRFGSPEFPGVPQCKIMDGWSVGDFIMKSGENKGWSLSVDIAPEGMIDPSACLGTHTVTVRVFDRYSGAQMDQKTTTYTVVQK